MEEVSGPVVGIALVCFRRFSADGVHTGHHRPVVSAVCGDHRDLVFISAFNALSLSPALAALLLRPKKRSAGPLRWFFRRLQPGFGSANEAMSASGGADSQERPAALLALIPFGCRRVRQEAAPASCRTKIRATCTSTLQLPEAASLQRTERRATQDRGNPRQDAGRSIHDERHRLQPAQPRPESPTAPSSSSP